MQRYRINHRLIVGLFVGTIAFGVIAYFLRSWQVDRKAGSFRDLAAKEMANNEILSAFEHQTNYVMLRPDEDDARIELANIGLEIINSPDAQPKNRGEAWGVLEDVVRRTGDPKLRRELIKLIVKFQPTERVVDALQHIEELLSNNPGDPELNELKVQALYRSKDIHRANELAADLIGLNLKSKEFSDDKMSVGDRPIVYALLAQSILQNSPDTDLARSVVDRMIELNPESATAHLRRSILLNLLQDPEEAKVALEKASELDPMDEDILIQMGSVALQDQKYDDASRIFQDALEKHPDNIRIYMLLARTALARSKLDEALAICEKGLREFGPKTGVSLTEIKIEILLASNDEAGVKKAIKDIENLSVPEYGPFIDYVGARLKLTKGLWVEGAKELERVRPLLINYRYLQSRAGNLLGFAYERLGKLDLARQAYMLVTRDFPGDQRAIDGLKRVQGYLAPPQQVDPDEGLTGLVKEQLALPEDEQDWKSIDRYIDETAEELGHSEWQIVLTRAQVFLQRKNFEEAAKLIRAATDLAPGNEMVLLGAVSVAALDPEKGPKYALTLLDKLVEKHGSTFQTRANRASLLLSMDLTDETLVPQLLGLADGIEDWKRGEQLRICTILARQLEQLGKLDEAGQLWARVVEISPTSLPLRMQVFNFAFQKQDDEAMQDAQQAILDLVKDESDPSYVLTQVKRMLTRFVRGALAREELTAGRNLLDKALLRQPQWHELHIVYGQLLSVLKEDPAVALEHYEDALRYGPPNPSALVQHIRLLTSAGQYASAREKMDLLPKAIKERALGQIEATVLWEIGEKEAAYDVAEKTASLRKDNLATQVWFANFAFQAENLEAAIAALHGAIELDPSQPQLWTQLATFHLQAKNGKLLYESLRDAQLAVDAEFIPLLTGKQYEYRNESASAEDIYLTLFADRLTELKINRQMADFYFLWGRRDASKEAKAIPYINRMLRQANEGQVPRNEPQVVWARNTAVRRLASTRDYRQVMKALQLLESGATDGKLSVGDQRLRAAILSDQPDPKSQFNAIGIYEDLRQQGALQRQDILGLAQLLNRTKNREGCKSLLTEALAKYPEDAELWSAYITTLIDDGDYSTANARLNRYKELNPDKSVIIRLGARLAAETGDRDHLRELLRSLLPSGSNVLDATQLKNILAVAIMASQYKDFELAEELLRFYVKRSPESVFQLTNFLAMYGDYEEAFEMMQDQFRNNPDVIMRLAIMMLRTRRAEIGDRFDEALDKMFAYAIRNDPDSFGRQSLRAELSELQEDYENSIKVYDDLLAGDELTTTVRARVMNNLGYLLAVKGVRLDEASQLVNQAMEILGPVDDMLDTRAVVRIARKQYDLAVADMVLGTSISRDPVKYFHLAQAQLYSGNEDAALEAWEEARQLEFEATLLSPLEQSSFRDFEERIEKLQ